VVVWHPSPFAYLASIVDESERRVKKTRGDADPPGFAYSRKYYRGTFGNPPKLLRFAWKWPQSEPADFGNHAWPISPDFWLF
jgi:hypothetical protein